ncbi:hypothetical protein C21_02647 [Arenibacter sp. NBRC 103722]|nr:hypothetical protein C21_02647 [Arenibacter sp. NBRC 103722]|tara:strand:- start:300 stop:440 length:141 start_codon:yes stop_codon:yes gene_type:complete
MDLGHNPKEERLIPEKIKENVQFNHIPFIIIGSELPLRSLAAFYGD